MAKISDLGLEDLLFRSSEDAANFNSKKSKKVVDRIEVSKAIAPLRSEKSASLSDFMSMVEKMVKLTMKDFEVEFVPDENKIPIKHLDIKLDHPMITYKVIERKPKELKPRVREDIDETGSKTDTSTERVGQIYGQKFLSTVQFDIFASVYITAEAVMEKFEEILLTYAGYFKKNGVSEVYFKKQLTDSAYDQYRQYMSVRSLQYHVETEKVTATFSNTIQEISILGL